jgi:type IV pilus assembly protein PilV
VATLRSHRAAAGVSLIEVLVAVLIFSVGLIGLAGLLIVSTRSNQEAFVRTQVTFLAGSMADRMRANPVGLWSKAYDASYPTTMTKIPACDSSNACGPADLASRDQAIWSSQLKTFLPGLGPTSIACDTSGAGYDATTVVNMRPPYGGRCTMTITWAERGYGTTDDKVDSGSLQSFTWVFEP